MREIFLAWSESLEQFVLEVIYGQRKGKRAALLRAALYSLSKVFTVAVKARRVLYNLRILRDSTLGVQVIAIGNITAGGTGKTPVVEKFARELKDAGRQVAILSRGYRSKPAPAHRRLLNKLLLREDITPPKIVSDGKSLLLDSETAGDEPYMLASNLKDVVVLVDKDRVKAGRYAIEKYGCDTLLLDDGFQYWKLRGRRRDVVLSTVSSLLATMASCSRAAPSASLPPTFPEPTLFSLRKAMGIRRSCGPKSLITIPRPASSSACTVRFILRMSLPATSTGWIC